MHPINMMSEIMVSTLAEFVAATRGADPNTPSPAGDNPTIIHTWSSFIDYINSLDLQTNWGKYEKEGFARCAVLDADGTIWKGDLSQTVVNQISADKRLSEKALPHFNSLLIFFDQQPQTDIYSARKALVNLLISGEIFKLGQKRSLGKEEVLVKFLGLYNYMLADYPLHELADLTRKIFDEGFGSGIFEGAKEIIEHLHSLGFNVYVLSAGVHEVVVHGVTLANIGIDPDHARGIKSTLVDGKIGERIVPPIMDRNGKASMARALCGGKPFIAFGDSVNSFDAGMLEDAKIAVAVEPKADDANTAFAKGYFVLDFERTVGGGSADTFKRPAPVQ